MNSQSNKVAVSILRWVLGLVILLEAAHLALSSGAAYEVAKAGLPKWIPPALGGSEALAAIIFLIPGAGLAGGYSLLFIFAIAIVIHFLHGQYDMGSLLIYGAAVYVCMIFQKNDTAEASRDR